MRQIARSWPSWLNGGIVADSIDSSSVGQLTRKDHLLHEASGRRHRHNDMANVQLSTKPKPDDLQSPSKDARVAFLGHPVTANGLAFLTGLCVMVLELVAGRLVARHLGASLHTWSSVIGIVLAGLSVGNYIGGRLADRFRPEQILG